MGVGLANIRKASEAQLRFIDRTRTDLAEILSADLKQVVTADTVNAKLVDWIELMNRRLPDDVWKIEKSREFLASPFRAQYRPGLDIIERNFRDGTSNRAHQSKTTEIADYNDLLFNDWAVHHFHLSDEYDGDFCKRTGPILFAYFYGDTVYFLDILEHGRRSPNVWADQHLVEVLDNNWPKITEKFHLKGALDLDRDISAPERIRLRNAGIASLLKANGKIFAPFGFGLNTAKGSTRFSMKAMQILRYLDRGAAEVQSRGNFTYPDGSRLSEAVPKNVRFGTGSAILRIRFRDGRFEFYEEKSGQIIMYSAKIVG